jgi:hypothetical protein
MFLRLPWLQDVKLSHDWGINNIIIQGNGIVRTIAITKHLSSQTKCLEVFLHYDFQNGFTKEEQNIAFTT